VFFLDDKVILSPSDLRAASACEFALLRTFDVKAKRMARPDEDDDLMLKRLGELGDSHEAAEHLRLTRLHPDGVRRMPQPHHSRAGFETAMEQTRAALQSDAVVIEQACFFDGDVVGYADFLERTDEGWRVADTKLARSANVAALLQIGEYAVQLLTLGVPVAPMARLVLGSGEVDDFPLSEILPVHRRRRARLQEIVALHEAEDGIVEWGDSRFTACGRCSTCEREVEATGDLFLVAGMRGSNRLALREAGITTIGALADSDGDVDGLSTARVDKLRAQARLQMRQLSAAEEDKDTVVHEVIDEAVIRRLPVPSQGDIFFDFEGDPLWVEGGTRKDWGLEYLFGMVEIDSGTPEFTAFWAHDRAEEKKALQDFVAHVLARLERWPDLHIYHYAAYEVTALKRLAARHAVHEDDIDQFLRMGLFVDLYATVRGGVRVSQRSYSIKKLEPLYMDVREAELQKGDASIVEYHRYQAARDEGRLEEADAILQGIADYNTEDCVSTWKLRDWLVSQVGLDQVGEATPVEGEREPNEKRQAQLDLEARVLELVGDIAISDREPEDQAVAMVASSVLYHAREDKPFWWGHYDRLQHPVSEWARDGAVAKIIGEPELLRDWDKLTPRSTFSRTYRVLVDSSEGAFPTSKNKLKAVYAAPVEFPLPNDQPSFAAHVLSGAGVQVTEVKDALSATGQQRQLLTIVENAPEKVQVTDYPVAFVPAPPPGTGSIDAALDELAEEVIAEHPSMAARAAIDVLLRRAPRMTGGGSLPVVGEGADRFIDAVTAALTGMTDSYVAVQGPPGTGKTYVGAHVLKRLVDLGWRIGVCTQSHAAIENFLDATVRAGIDPALVGKVADESSNPDREWTALTVKDGGLAGFLAARRAEGQGCVVGGTAWALTNTNQIERGELDLVVIDEAGQYSLAKTLAVSLAGARLLLLGDPAQLPQVSQGYHAEPINESALGWLADGADVLPADLGYFLETTWRMHPALTSIVSTLSYGGKLVSHTAHTSARSLDDVEPGLHVRLVDHVENTRWSVEEAAAVVDLAHDLLDRTWHDPEEKDADDDPVGPRPMTERDVIVLTPYGAQVGSIRAALAAAGLPGVRVGTIDKFQGQEAAVAIVSMAASSRSDVSRGLDFLLDRHRINVAISRGKHAAYLVRSVALTDFGPRTPKELIELGAFLAVCDAAVETTTQPRA
jgi:uncharacterized protein